MPAPELISSTDHVVQLDFGTFYLYAEPGLDLELIADPDGVAQRGQGVAVLSPHQNNFRMPLRVEVWTAAPPDDLDEWEEASAVHLDIGDAGLFYASPTCDEVTLDVPTGSYHALITGRGFVGIGWPGSTTPGDSWRIRLWPGSGPAELTRLREYSEPRVIHPAPEYRDAGVAAVRRLHAALDTGSPLSGERGTARAQRRMPGTRRRLYRAFHDSSGWLTQSSGRSPAGFTHHGGSYSQPAFGDANRIVPRNCEIRCLALDATSPRFSVSTWTWLRRVQDGADVVLVAPEPQMTLRFDLDTEPANGDTPMTSVRATHDQVPIEWVEDLSAYWAWMLERADYEFDLGDARSTGYAD